MEYGFTFEAMRKMQAAKKAEAQQYRTRGDSATNRNTSRSAEGERFRALYDRDEGLRVAYVTLATAETQQFYDATNRGWLAFDSSLKSAGHALTARGIQKFQEYLSHQNTDTHIIDLSRVETWVDSFNRAVSIGVFADGDFVSDAPKTPTAPLTGKAREDADRAEYRANLRAELGDAKYEAMYGRNGQNPLGARRPNF